MSKLLSGVRNSCDMFARNSDLYFEVSASCSAFSSSAWRACSTSVFLRSTSAFCSASSLAFSCSSWLVFCNSSCRLCNSLASDCDCLSRSSVRVLASIVFKHDADRFDELIEERLVRRAELFERGQFHDRLDLAFEQDRQHDDVRGRRLAQTGGDLDVIGGRLVSRMRSFSKRGLADQSFAERKLVADVLAAAEGIAGQQLQVRLVVFRCSSASSFGVSIM